jgi:hypothetical protein
MYITIITNNYVVYCYLSSNIFFYKLDKSKITIMKSLAKPPEMVVQVMNAVCVLFEKKENWDESKKLMVILNLYQNKPLNIIIF